MDLPAVLEHFDEQVRRNPQPRPGETVEREPNLTRVLAGDGSWALVSWSVLEERDLDVVITRQIERLRPLGCEWEWKHYSYDTPPSLPERLIAAGFTAGEVETVLVAEIAGLSSGHGLPDGVELELVSDAAGAGELVRMLDGVFGRGIPGMQERLLAGITADPPTTVALAATVDGRPVAGGRVEFDGGSDFAGLWGGATVPEWRNRGIFTALVARAVALAAERGYRYAQVDAAPTSRPILERLGFAELAKTTPYTYPAAAP